MMGRHGLDVLATHGRAARALARQARLARRHRHPFGRLGLWMAPLAPMLVYLPLVATGSFPLPSGGASALAYAALGYVIWSLLVEVVLAPARGLSAHRADLHTPMAALLAGVWEALERAGARAVVLVPLAWAVAGGLDPLGLLMALILLPAALALALAAGLLLAFWAVPWPDMAAGAATALRVTLLPSLVLFPLPDAPWAWAATVLNPLAVWIETLRTLAMTGGVPPTLSSGFVIWGVVGPVLLVVAGRAFIRLAPRLREMAP